MSVHIDPKLWRPSNYVRMERRVKQCKLCGCRVRGADHENGSHHINRVKSSRAMAKVAGSKAA